MAPDRTTLDHGHEPHPQARAESLTPQPDRQESTTGRAGAGLGWRVTRDAAVVGGVAILIGAALTILISRPRSASFQALAVYSLISLCFAVAYIGIVHGVLGGWLTRGGRWWRLALVRAAAVLVATLLGGEVAYWLIDLLGGNAGRLRLLGVGFAILAAISLIEMGYERLRRQVREVELRQERVTRHALRAELTALQARTDPHFLFNSLNTVAGLIEEDPERAVAVVTRLAGFFRHTLAGSRGGLVPLDDEIAAAATYLEIQGLRFPDRLAWSIEVEPRAGRAAVPAFILQPLLENTVLHGRGASRPHTRVTITARSSSDGVELIVEDDGPGPGASSHRGSGTALGDLRERLSLLYGDAATLETGVSSMGGFRVRVALPLTQPAGPDGDEP